MTSIKRDDINGVTIGGKWIAKTAQVDIQPVEEGIIVQEATGQRTLYPWWRVDDVKMV